MRYNAYHICKPTEFVNALKVAEGTDLVELAPTFYTNTREGAAQYAKNIGGATIIPVNLLISRPFINTPDDPFVALKHFDLKGDRAFLRALAGRYEAQLTNTNFWEEMKNIHGEQITLQSLFMDNPEDFMELPLEVRLLVEDAAIREWVASAGYDGFIYQGMAPDTDGVNYFPLNYAAIRYGVEEYV